ncbi:glycosyltransferase family 2 protein [Candidatus Microgenomates bacterium]|nr:glycosyltransferase family 2 protein [Candidatus Microgenomates bacterium]
MLSVIIPSRNEQYLAKTVDDIFNKAKGEIEVIVILDENDQKLTPRPHLIVAKKIGKPGMKSAINQGVDIARGKYIMKTDAHCMFGEGFDVILTQNHQNDWIQIPRRYSLQAETWSIKPNRPIVDYEYFVFPFAEVTSVRTGGKWYGRAEDRKELLIDETMVFQGSCWFTTKEHYNRIGRLEINPKTKDEFILEPEELAFKTWLSGGKVMVSKKTWYAHYHKGNGNRGYFIDKKTMRKQRIFHINYWMHDKWPKATLKMEWFIERFWPIPGWPQDWKDPKHELEYLKRLTEKSDPNKIMI